MKKPLGEAAQRRCVEMGLDPSPEPEPASGEDRLDLLHKAKDDFWLNFSKLIADHLKTLPPELHDDALMMFGEASSVYGSCYRRYM